MACLNDTPENASNFLRWRRCNGVALPAPVDGLPLCYDLYPAAAVKTDFRKEDITAYLPAVNGDVFKFFINTDVPKNYGAVADLRMGLIYQGRAVGAGFTAAVAGFVPPAPAADTGLELPQLGAAGSLITVDWLVADGATVVLNEQVANVTGDIDGGVTTSGPLRAGAAGVLTQLVPTGYQGQVGAVVGTIAPPVVATLYRPYGTLTIENLPDGVYNPYLYLVGTPNVPRHIANALKVVNYQPWERDTVMATFRHGAPLAGVPYPNLPADFRQQFRLYFVLQGLKYPEKSEDYTDRNGQTRITSLQVQKTYDLTSSDFVDAETYEAAVLMLAHEDVRLDGRPMRKASPLDLVEEFTAANVFTIRGRVEDTDFAFSLASC